MGLFAQFGRIIECRVLMDASTGLSRCKAFVQFDTRSEAAAALALNGMKLEGTKRPLIVKLAENHSKRGIPGVMMSGGGVVWAPGRGGGMHHRGMPGPPMMGMGPPRVLFPMGPGGLQTLHPIVGGAGGQMSPSSGGMMMSGYMMPGGVDGLNGMGAAHSMSGVIMPGGAPHMMGGAQHMMGGMGGPHAGDAMMSNGGMMGGMMNSGMGGGGVVSDGVDVNNMMGGGNGGAGAGMPNSNGMIQNGVGALRALRRRSAQSMRRPPPVSAPPVRLLARAQVSAVSV